MVYKLTSEGKKYKERIENEVGPILDISKYTDLFPNEEVENLSFNIQLFNRYLLELVPIKGVDSNESFADALRYLPYIKDLLKDVKSQKNIYELNYPKELVKAVISVLLDNNMVDLKIKLNPLGVNLLNNYSGIKTDTIKNAELVVDVKYNKLDEMKYISTLYFSILHSLNYLHLFEDIRAMSYNFEVELPSLSFTEEEFKRAFPSTYSALMEMTDDEERLRKAMSFIVKELDKWKIKQIEERKKDMHEYEKDIKQEVKRIVDKVYDIVRKG